MLYKHPNIRVGLAGPFLPVIIRLDCVCVCVCEKSNYPDDKAFVFVDFF